MSRKPIREYMLDHFVYKVSIRKKLICYFLIAILLPSAMLTVFMYTRSRDIITQKTNLAVSQNMNSVKLIIEQKIDSINDISMMISINPMIQRIFSSPQPTDRMDIVNELIYLDESLESYYDADYSTPTHTIIIPRLYMVNRPAYAQFNISTRIFNINQISAQSWYDSLSGATTFVGVENVSYAGNSIRALKMAKKLYSLGEGDIINQYAALLTIDIDTSYFNNMLSNYKMTDGSQVMIIDNNQNVILSSDNSWLDKNLKNSGYGKFLTVNGNGYASSLQRIDGKELLLSHEKIEPLNWEIVNLSPVSEISHEQSAMNRIILLMILVCMTFALLAALLLSGNILRPIRKLVKSMSGIRNGNFNIVLDYKYRDEFSPLIEQYKIMMAEIGELIDKLYVSEINKKGAELKAKEAEIQTLQAQINPHFFYNALDSINLYSTKYNIPVISEMIQSLSNFYRYGLSNGKWIITLEDEIRHVESYLQICRLRYGEKLNYSIDLPAELSVYLTVKFIIQPLVENSVTHGISQIDGEGMIAITVSRIDDTVEIRVVDNGAGADVYELNEVLTNSEETSKSFGIKNVNGRIRQVFGDEYGLTFCRNVTSGITAVVRIPALKTMEDYHAQNDPSR